MDSTLATYPVDSLFVSGTLCLDRSLENLIPTSDRPLSSDREALEKRYNERYAKYVSYADSIIDSNRRISEVADDIKGDFYR